MSAPLPSNPFAGMQIETHHITMQVYQRILSAELRQLLDYFPAVALTGPRHCGKTTQIDPAACHT